MLKIALVCQHGASTGICVEKMKQAAAKDNIECTIAAYPDSEMGTLVKLADGFWNDEWGENFERCT